jgi:hypothetical protein
VSGSSINICAGAVSSTTRSNFRIVCAQQLLARGERRLVPVERAIQRIAQRLRHGRQALGPFRMRRAGVVREAGRMRVDANDAGGTVVIDGEPHQGLRRS